MTECEVRDSGRAGVCEARVVRDGSSRVGSGRVDVWSRPVPSSRGQAVSRRDGL